MRATVLVSSRWFPDVWFVVQVSQRYCKVLSVKLTGHSLQELTSGCWLILGFIHCVWRCLGALLCGVAVFIHLDYFAVHRAVVL